MPVCGIWECLPPSLLPVTACKETETENNPPKKERATETEPLTPLGEKGFIAGAEGSSLPHEFPLSGLISGHCWNVTKEEYAGRAGEVAGKGRGEAEGRGSGERWML